MATTSFTTGSVDVPGAWPRRVRDTPPGLRRYWLGHSGRMIELPAPKIGREVTLSSGESVHVSAGGTSSVFRRPGPVKRRFVLAWDRLAGRDWQVVNGFYRRVIVGPGPWCYFPPEDVNRLTEAVSLGRDSSAWATTGSGTVTVDTATSPVDPAGVLRWTGATANSTLTAHSAVDPVSAVPYLPGEPLTLTVWAWTVTGTRQVRLRAGGRAADGAATNNVDTLVTLTTTPQRVTLTVAAGALDTADETDTATDAATTHVAHVLAAVGNGPDVLVAAPQLEYAAAATDWALGAGVPRVVWTDPPARGLDARLRSAVTMTLAE